ncbi:MAG: hypothetical protein LAT76_11925 [Schleiferiaceae bacterium]|nr:hypothetical protein [Schleiferiaceae bacterium]
MKNICIALLLTFSGYAFAQKSAPSPDTTAHVLKQSTLESMIFDDFSDAQLAQLQWALLGMHKQTRTANGLMIAGSVVVSVAVSVTGFPVVLAVVAGACTFTGVVLSLNATKWYKRGAFVPLTLPDDAGYKVRKRLRQRI